VSSAAERLLPPLPDGWIATPVRYGSTCLDGKRVPLNAEERTKRQGDYPYWGANGIVDYVDEYLFHEPLVLLGEDGAPFFDKAKPVAFFVDGKIWVNNHIHVLRIDQKLEPRFVVHALNATDFGPWIEGSTRDKLTQDKMGSILLPTPPLTRQRAIAVYLDRETARLEALVAAKEGVLRLLAEKRRALITRAVTRGLDPRAPLRESGIPWLGPIPNHWRVDRAKFVFRQSALPVRDEDEMVTCFRDGQVTLRRNRREEGFTNANLELGYQGIRSGQLMLHSMDAFAGAIGVSDSDGKCSPEYIICDPQTAQVDSYYYGHLLRIMALAGFIQASCPAVRERAPRIRFSDFGEMYIPVPPVEEQRAIVERVGVDLTRLDDLRLANERTIVLLRERRAALIAAAVTGQVEVA